MLYQIDASVISQRSASFLITHEPVLSFFFTMQKKCDKRGERIG